MGHRNAIGKCVKFLFGFIFITKSPKMKNLPTKILIVSYYDDVPREGV